MKNYTKKIIYLLIFVLMFFALAGSAKANYDYDHSDCSNPLIRGSNCVPPASLCKINNFSYSNDSVTLGDGVTLNWTTSNCTDVIISNITGTVPVNGTKLIWPTSTTLYTLIAYGTNSPVQTKTLTVDVVPRPTMTGSISAANSSCQIAKGASTCLVSFSWSTQNPVATSAVTHDGSTIAVGNSGSQTFNISSGNQSYFLYNNSQNLATATVNASCVAGSTWNGYVCVANVNSICEINNFSASDTSISEGDSTVLRWNTSNCDNVKISNFGYVSEDGSETIYPTRDTTYLLTAYGSDGSHVSDSVRIYVDNNISNNNYYNYNNCDINSFTASDTYVNPGDKVILRWSTTDCDNVNISNVGDVSLDGSRTIYPNTTATYLLRAYGDNTVSRSIQINVNYNRVISTPIYNSNVVTTVATNVSQTSAQINGLITGTNYDNTSTYFQYGTDINLGLRTASRPTLSKNNFSEYLTNLSPKTIYYFQAITEGPRGTYRGAVEVFQTLGTTYVNNVSNVKNTTTTTQKTIVQGVTVANEQSPIMLKIENRYKEIGVGDLVDYTVTYKNISKNKLTDPMIQVVMPKGINLINYSTGVYSSDSKTLSVPISDLDSSTDGVIYLQGKVESIDQSLAQIVTTTILIYTNSNGAQENAIAYVLNSPKENNLLGASAFFGGVVGFGLIGWLLFIIFILLLILIARSFYSKRVVIAPIH